MTSKIPGLCALCTVDVLRAHYIEADVAGRGVIDVAPANAPDVIQSMAEGSHPISEIRINEEEFCPMIPVTVIQGTQVCTLHASLWKFDR